MTICEIKERMLNNVCCKYGSESDRAIAFAYILDSCPTVKTLQVTYNVFMTAPFGEDED